jgi:hypothetical protein
MRTTTMPEAATLELVEALQGHAYELLAGVPVAVDLVAGEPTLPVDAVWELIEACAALGSVLLASSDHRDFVQPSAIAAAVTDLRRAADRVVLAGVQLDAEVDRALRLLIDLTALADAASPASQAA